MSDDSSSKFLAQFGDELYSPSAKDNTTTPAALDGKIVMLYFSAHWCPPCRRFTPLLISLYNQLKSDPSKADTFELVFVSLDRQESEFNEYIADMPWLCIPYSVPQDVKHEISMKYGASGIPHLVIIDATAERNIITSEGVMEVQQDPLGVNFPWKPKTFAQIWPNQFLTKSGLVDSSTLDNKHLMLYFSAKWCPPCQAFTPVLSNAYSNLKEKHGDEFELLFVSSDREVDSFNEYYGKMTFGAMPYEEREAKLQLANLFGIRGIPALLILGPADENGNRKLINDNLRGVIEAGELDDFPFHPKPYQDLAVSAEGINEHRSLVVFCENEDDDEQNELVDLVKTVAAKRKDSNIKFFYATQPGGVVAAVRKLLKIENRMDGVIMALLDIPDNGGFYVSAATDLNQENILQFLDNPGERHQMTK